MDPRRVGGEAFEELDGFRREYAGRLGRFPRDVILLAIRYYLQLGAAAERIAGIRADRGIDISGRTILRWVQKFGPAHARTEEFRLRHAAVPRFGHCAAGRGCFVQVLSR
jgi:transposase-like protein